jgi:phage/plasmid-like protein (TIGR03299 family)
MTHVSLPSLFKGLKNPKDTLEALQQMAADFVADKRDVYFLDDGGEPVKIENFAAIVNTNEMHGLSVMRSRYGLVQYRDALDFLSEAVANGSATFEGGRATDSGARIHIAMKAAKSIELGPGDRIDCYYTVSTSHDGSNCITAMCTPIHSALQTVFTPLNDGVMKIKHTARANERLTKARRMTTRMHEFFTKYEGHFKDFVQTNLNDQEARDYFRMLVPETDGPNKVRSENIRDKLYDIFKLNPLLRGLPSCQGTLFGAFQAAMIYADLYKTVRKSKIRNELDAKLESRLNGDGARFKAEAYAASLQIMRMFD